MYLIDGHNLIPKIPGMSLSAVDDEERLINLLHIYARRRSKREIEVFFDGAPPGFSGGRDYGTIHAQFIVQGQTADEAIRRRLVSLGRGARNAIVVSSDRQVKVNARALGATVETSETFAREIWLTWQEEDLQNRQARERKTARAPGSASRPVEKPKAGGGTGAGGMSKNELGDWLDLFGVNPADAEKPIEPPNTPRKPKKKPQRPNHGFADSDRKKSGGR